MKATILLFGHNPGIGETLNRTLRQEGYGVALASSNRQALTTLRKGKCDLVLLDLDVPASGARGILVRIVAICVTLPSIIHFSLPVIIMTGRSDQSWLAKHEGITAVLVKPLETRILLKTIDRAFAGTKQASRSNIKKNQFMNKALRLTNNEPPE